MNVLLSYIAFLLVTYFFVLQIFRLTTYHRYFFKALPLLLGYSILVGYAMSSIKPFHGFWFAQIWGSGVLFLLKMRSEARTARALMSLTSDSTLTQLSTASTRAYFIMSAATYLVTYAVSFLVFLNLTF